MQLALDFRFLSRRSGSTGRQGLAAPDAGQTPPAASSLAAPPQVLAPHACLRLDRPQGRVLDCLEGCLWITVDGETRDVILEAGQRFQPDSGRKLIVQALVSSRLRIDDVT